jgi:hypothetical protein
LSPWPQVQRLQKALALESDIDFRAVETERTAFVRALSQSLSSDDGRDVLERSLAYRMGRLTHGQFYGFLNCLAARRGVTLARYPQLQAYVRYLEVSDGIDSRRLFGELESLKDAAASVRARSMEQKRLWAVLEDRRLLQRLADHAFGPSEWARYESRRREVLALGRRLADLGEKTSFILTPTLLASFEDFYRAALRRNDALVDRLLRRAQEAGAPSVALVTGGFHTPGLEERLARRGLSYAVVTPKVGNVSDAGTYLDAFARSYTPLEQMVLGERLMMNPPSVTSSAVRRGEGVFGGFRPQATLMERFFVLGWVSWGKAHGLVGDLSGFLKSLGFPTVSGRMRGESASLSFDGENTVDLSVGASGEKVGEVSFAVGASRRSPFSRMVRALVAPSSLRWGLAPLLTFLPFASSAAEWAVANGRAVLTPAPGDTVSGLLESVRVAFKAADPSAYASSEWSGPFWGRPLQHMFDLLSGRQLRAGETLTLPEGAIPRSVLENLTGAQAAVVVPDVSATPSVPVVDQVLSAADVPVIPSVPAVEPVLPSSPIDTPADLSSILDSWSVSEWATPVMDVLPLAGTAVVLGAALWLAHRAGRPGTGRFSGVSFKGVALILTGAGLYLAAPWILPFYRSLSTLLPSLGDARSAVTAVRSLLPEVAWPGWGGILDSIRGTFRGWSWPAIQLPSIDVSFPDVVGAIRSWNPSAAAMAPALVLATVAARVERLRASRETVTILELEAARKRGDGSLPKLLARRLLWDMGNLPSLIIQVVRGFIPEMVGGGIAWMALGHGLAAPPAVAALLSSLGGPVVVLGGAFLGGVFLRLAFYAAAQIHGFGHAALLAVTDPAPGFARFREAFGSYQKGLSPTTLLPGQKLFVPLVTPAEQAPFMSAPLYGGRIAAVAGPLANVGVLGALVVLMSEASLGGWEGVVFAMLALPQLMAAVSPSDWKYAIVGGGARLYCGVISQISGVWPRNWKPQDGLPSDWRTHAEAIHRTEPRGGQSAGVAFIALRNDQGRVELRIFARKVGKGFNKRALIGHLIDDAYRDVMEEMAREGFAPLFDVSHVRYGTSLAPPKARNAHPHTADQGREDGRLEREEEIFYIGEKGLNADNEEPWNVAEHNPVLRRKVMERGVVKIGRAHV